MKNNCPYACPNMEVVLFEDKDIITTSSMGDVLPPDILAKSSDLFSKP